MGHPFRAVAEKSRSFAALRMTKLMTYARDGISDGWGWL